jgi:predicted nucleotidyltransferase
LPDSRLGDSAAVTANDASIASFSARTRDVIAILPRSYRVRLVSAYLFGSHAEGRAHRESDIDVACLLDCFVYPDEDRRFNARVDSIGAIGSALESNAVDLVVLNDAPPSLARAIITRGRRVFCRDSEADHIFMMVAQLVIDIASELPARRGDRFEDYREAVHTLGRDGRFPADLTEIVLERGYGVRRIGKPAVVDTHRLFAIGSTTEAMTAALIGMLVGEKTVDCDDPVVKHLPWFQLMTLWSRASSRFAICSRAIPPSLQLNRGMMPAMLSCHYRKQSHDLGQGGTPHSFLFVKRPRREGFRPRLLGSLFIRFRKLPCR